MVREQGQKEEDQINIIKIIQARGTDYLDQDVNSSKGCEKFSDSKYTLDILQDARLEIKTRQNALCFMYILPVALNNPLRSLR